MSAFLGKIHYLLYNKIQLQENLLEEILRYAERRNIPVEKIKTEGYEKFGYPEKRPLEEVIDQGNIHGWLQLKIQGVEQRTAAVVTELVNKYSIKIEDIAKLYFQNGKNIMLNLEDNDFTPKELFALIFDFMLEGMPCDRINEISQDTEDEFSWKTTRCIHEEYWNKVNGEISNFYILRDAWINGFISGNGTKTSYVRAEDGYNKIRREV